MLKNTFFPDFPDFSWEFVCVIENTLVHYTEHYTFKDLLPRHNYERISSSIKLSQDFI